MIAVATATSTAPSVIVPPTPPNTEHGRSRANSLLSSSSAPSSSSPKCAHVCTKSCLSSGSRSGRTKFVNFAEKLEEVQEKTPGAFYENDTDVPNNTPYSTEAGTEYTPDSPRSGSAPSLSGDLAIIDEVLEGLPSKKSSPASSTFSGSTSKYSSLCFYCICTAQLHTIPICTTCDFFSGEQAAAAQQSKQPSDQASACLTEIWQSQLVDDLIDRSSHLPNLPGTRQPEINHDSEHKLKLTHPLT